MACANVLRDLISCIGALTIGAWGYGLFQLDNDFDTLSELGHDMGLTKLDDKEVDSIYLSIYGGASHHEVVRKHLDSGVLADFVKVKEAKMLSIPNSSQDQQLEYLFRYPCYGYVLLGACAMTLGCHLPESYIDMLKIQIHKALFGPDRYRDGEPYDFESEGLIETTNAMTDDSNDELNGLGCKGLNVIRPGGIFNTGMGNSTDSVIIKELRSKLHSPNACAECSTRHGSDGSALLQCARCKERKYYSVICQKKHWKIHKKLYVHVVRKMQNQSLPVPTLFRL
ncbi:hypothetical protein BU25DRAFT_434264 [Macroventuria anomochaeta]|uniref:Uncharacterized protein n=1 Tax=Macroventuria anomochaeta TaxID=301207 RepID=A0ACB6RPZ2_9PLEO|nr:uncharacterized protein BU25DRAFT_434264 [Macroventuria anomochaeta]KAF2623470.1 hypothetical protein BU25DRAFT_434264 [Macroventuria anomochaeta]